MSADAIEPQDPVFPWDLGTFTFTPEHFKTFNEKINEDPNNLLAWYKWIHETVAYKNHLRNKAAELMQDAGQASKEYMRL